MSRISVDLATAFPDKWAALDPGEHALQVRAKNPGNYLDSDLSTAITFVKVVNWSINITATNCTADASNPTVVPSNTTAENPVILKFNKVTGYTLPASVVLDGIADDGYTWAVSSDGAVGTITIIAPTGNITGTITGVATTTTIDGGTYKWLDNAALTEWTQEINFTSNGASYSGMRYTGNGTAMMLQYMDADGEWQTVYNYDEDASTGSWVNDAYKIVDLGASAQTVTAIFKADFIANTTKLTQLATPQNVSADGTTVSWDAVENATSYAVLADGTSIGEYSVPSGYTVTLTSWDEQVGSNDGAAVKFNTPPTSENDYDYRTGKLYDDTGLYNASGAKVTQPIIVDEVSKVYVFTYKNYGSSAGGYKLNEGSVEHGGEWSNPAVISLTENSTLSLLHAQD